MNPNLHSHNTKRIIRYYYSVKKIYILLKKFGELLKNKLLLIVNYNFLTDKIEYEKKIFFQVYFQKNG